MKIRKDILEKLEIDSIHLQTKNEKYFCVPLEMSGTNWIVAIDDDLTLEGMADLIIRKKMKVIIMPIYVTTIKNNSKYAIYSMIHNITFRINELNEDQIETLKKIREIETEQEKWNKRKEERFEIKEDIKGIGLDNPEQQLITKENILPCFINNVSYSGSQVITYRNYFPQGKIICLNLSFIQPVQNIPLKAIVRHYEDIITQSNDKLGLVSMEFEDPPLIWQDRMNRLEKYIQEKIKK